MPKDASGAIRPVPRWSRSRRSWLERPEQCIRKPAWQRFGRFASRIAFSYSSTNGYTRDEEEVKKEERKKLSDARATEGKPQCFNALRLEIIFGGHSARVSARFTQGSMSLECATTATLAKDRLTRTVSRGMAPRASPYLELMRWEKACSADITREDHNDRARNRT